MRYATLLLLALTLLACGGSKDSTAQTTDTTQRQAPRQRAAQTPAERAQRQTERMRAELGLTDAQVLKVEVINLKYANAAERLRGQGGDRRAALQRARELQGQKNEELRTVLTEVQFAQYETQQARERERRRQQMRARRGAGGFN